jgi:hypothetical protein
VRSPAAVVVLVTVALTAPAYAALAAPGDLHLASSGPTGAASDGEALVPSVSADGTTVAFFSTSTNLHPADTDPGPDVYVKNVRTGEVILASRAASGAKGNGDSHLPAISADGRRVAFVSTATNLHPAGVRGVYVKDLSTGRCGSPRRRRRGRRPTTAPTGSRCRGTAASWPSRRPPRTCIPWTRSPTSTSTSRTSRVAG